MMKLLLVALGAVSVDAQATATVSLPGGGGYFGATGVSYTIGSDDAWTTGTFELGTLEQSGTSPRAAILTLLDGQIVEYTAGNTVMVDKLNGANVNIYGGVLEGSNFVMARASTPDGDGSCNTGANTSPGAWGAAAGQSPGHAAWLLYNMDTASFIECQGDGWCGNGGYTSCRSLQYTKTWIIGMTMAVAQSLTGTAGVLFAALTNSDCTGTWSCSEACEAATDSDRTFITTTFQQGTGAACPTAPTADCAYGDGACFPGCMDDTANNYDPLATSDDGSCICPGFKEMQHNRAVCSACNGDMDGDLLVTALDILSLLGDFGLCDPRLISDGNNDGCVGIQDLLLLLPEFGKDCTGCASAQFSGTWSAWTASGGRPQSCSTQSTCGSDLANFVNAAGASLTSWKTDLSFTNSKGTVMLTMANALSDLPATGWGEPGYCCGDTQFSQPYPGPWGPACAPGVTLGGPGCAPGVASGGNPYRFATADDLNKLMEMSTLSDQGIGQGEGMDWVIAWSRVNLLNSVLIMNPMEWRLYGADPIELNFGEC